MYTYFYVVSNALSQQRFCPRSLSSVCIEWLLRDCAKDVALTFCQWFTFCYLFYLFCQRLEILDTDRTIQNDLTDKDILLLADKDQLLLYKCHRKSDHLIWKKFACGVVLKNSWPNMKTKIRGAVCLKMTLKFGCSHDQLLHVSQKSISCSFFFTWNADKKLLIIIQYQSCRVTQASFLF